MVFPQKTNGFSIFALCGALVLLGSLWNAFLGPPEPLESSWGAVGDPLGSLGDPLGTSWEAQSRCKTPTWRPQSLPGTRTWRPKVLQDPNLEAQSLTRHQFGGPRRFQDAILEARSNSQSPAWRQHAFARPHLSGKESSEELNFDD